MTMAIEEGILETCDADLLPEAAQVVNGAAAPPFGCSQVGFICCPCSLARDPLAGVRCAVCGGLVQLLHLQPEALVPQMRDIIEYMLESSQVGGSLFLPGLAFWRCM